MQNETISCCDRSSRLTAQSAFPFRRPLRWNKSWNKENAVPAVSLIDICDICLVRVFGRKCPTHFFCFQLIDCGALACMGCRISTGQFCHLHFVILEWLASFWPHFLKPSAHPVAQFSNSLKLNLRRFWNSFADGNHVLKRLTLQVTGFANVGKWICKMGGCS